LRLSVCRDVTFFCAVICLLALPLQVKAKADWYHYQEAIMGTRVAVDLFAHTQPQAEACSQKVFSEMKRIDQLMSPYIVSSELYKINRLASTHPVNVSQEIFDLIQRSFEFSKLSKGIFDITFSSVGYLYHYRQHIHPSEQQIKKNLSAINYKSIVLDNEQHSIFFKHKNTKIDLGGIAKGYAVDNAIRILQVCGIENALVSAGGDSKILGDKNGRPWMMGIQHPRDKNKVVVSIPLSNTAISTSGDYERYFIEDGRRYHHIINPFTGESAKKSWSVSVIGDEAIKTDALSTTLFILGAEKSLKLINNMENTEAIIIDSHGKMFYSNGLMPPVPH